jgi:hypothetical protein
MEKLSFVSIKKVDSILGLPGDKLKFCHEPASYLNRCFPDHTCRIESDEVSIQPLITIDARKLKNQLYCSWLELYVWANIALGLLLI